MPAAAKPTRVTIYAGCFMPQKPLGVTPGNTKTCVAGDAFGGAASCTARGSMPASGGLASSSTTCAGGEGNGDGVGSSFGAAPYVALVAAPLALLRLATAVLLACDRVVEMSQKPERPPERWAKALAFATSSLMLDGMPDILSALSSPSLPSRSPQGNSVDGKKMTTMLCGASMLRQ